MQVMDDQKAAYYWGTPASADLQAFVRTHRHVPRNGYDDKKYHAALHILRKRGESLDGSAPAPSAPAAPPQTPFAPRPKPGTAPIVLPAPLGSGPGTGVSPVKIVASATAPKSSPAPAPTAHPLVALRGKPSGMKALDQKSALFYWPGADEALMHAFVAGNATTPLSTYDERRYWAAVHLLGLDKPQGGVVVVGAAPAAGGVGAGHVYALGYMPAAPGQPPVRQLIVSAATDVASGYLTDELPEDLLKALDDGGFQASGDALFNVDPSMTDVEAQRELAGLGLAADPQVWKIATT